MSVKDTGTTDTTSIEYQCGVRRSGVDRSKLAQNWGPIISISAHRVSILKISVSGTVNIVPGTSRVQHLFITGLVEVFQVLQGLKESIKGWSTWRPYIVGKGLSTPYPPL